MRSTKLHSWIRRALGLQAVPVPPDIFAVSFDSLCYARIVRKSEGFQVVEFRDVELHDGTFAGGPLGGPLRDPVELREKLGHLMEEASRPFESASLVLPDGWLRLMFLETENLSGGPRAREEALRWKLGKVVPFRTDELRIDALEVNPVPGQALPKRVLVGFGSESLLSQIEQVFSDQGVQLGQISNSSLSLLAALEGPLGGVGLGLLFNVVDGTYSFLCCRQGEPIIHRFKNLGDLAGRESGRMILQDLKLSRHFLAEQLQDSSVGRVVLLAPKEVEMQWIERLEQVFEIPPLVVEMDHLRLAGSASTVSVRAAATLIGAAAWEVA